jgi:hypothetical protein
MVNKFLTHFQPLRVEPIQIFLRSKPGGVLSNGDALVNQVQYLNQEKNLVRYLINVLLRSRRHIILVVPLPQRTAVSAFMFYL